eukprot:103844-Pleurochrysis_carterae.AAC.1
MLLVNLCPSNALQTIHKNVLLRLVSMRADISKVLARNLQDDFWAYFEAQPDDIQRLAEWGAAPPSLPRVLRGHGFSDDAQALQ